MALLISSPNSSRASISPCSLASPPFPDVLHVCRCKSIRIHTNACRLGHWPWDRAGRGLRLGFGPLTSPMATPLARRSFIHSSHSVTVRIHAPAPIHPHRSFQLAHCCPPSMHTAMQWVAPTQTPVTPATHDASASASVTKRLLSEEEDKQSEQATAVRRHVAQVEREVTRIFDGLGSPGQGRAENRTSG